MNRNSLPLWVNQELYFSNSKYAEAVQDYLERERKQKDYLGMTKEELVRKCEGKDSMIEELKHQLDVAQKALINCANKESMYQKR
ncbi:MAG: hypothetical protein WC325_11630 [Candidatus Bathyarchaeia archaeon]|jgi:hypothetical protein